MAGDKLSTKEAALIAQARGELKNEPTVQPGAPATAPAVGVEGAAPARSPDPAERIALLMAAARAETERRRQQHKMFYLWVPVAVISVTGLWTLLWMWQKL